MEILFKGILLGLMIAAPVGPIGVLCIRKTLQYGRLSGLFSGLGAATADLVYAVTVALGITLISDLFLERQLWLRLIGGGFLVILGVKTFFSPSLVQKKEPAASTSLVSDFISTFLLTLTNPLTILAFFAMFASFGLSEVMDKHSNIILLLFGIFAGSSLWWLFLSEGITFFRNKIGDNLLLWINRITGVALAIFGVLSWISLAL